MFTARLAALFLSACFSKSSRFSASLFGSSANFGGARLPRCGLGGVDKFEPVSGGGEMDHSEKTAGQLVVAGGDGAVDLQVTKTRHSDSVRSPLLKPASKSSIYRITAGTPRQRTMTLIRGSSEGTEKCPRSQLQTA